MIRSLTSLFDFSVDLNLICEIFDLVGGSLSILSKYIFSYNFSSQFNIQFDQILKYLKKTSYFLMDLTRTHLYTKLNLINLHWKCVLF